MTLLVLGMCAMLTLAGCGSGKDIIPQSGGQTENLTGSDTGSNAGSNEDYASISFDRDGSLSYTRLSNNSSCSGEIYFDRQFAGTDEEQDRFSIRLNGVTSELAGGEQYYPADGVDQTEGLFYISHAGGEDYLFLQEVGNGDTAISATIFQNIGEDGEIINNGECSWLLHRKGSTGTDTAVRETDSGFYAFAWTNSDDGLLLQKMKPYTWDDSNEYTLRRFTGAYFEEEDFCSVSYRLSDSFNTRLGEDSAACGDGIQIAVALGVFVQSRCVCLQEGCHLVDEGSRASCTYAVHALFNVAVFEVYDLGVLTAQFYRNVGLWSACSEGSRYCDDFLYERDAEMGRQSESA